MSPQARIHYVLQPKVQLTRTSDTTFAVASATFTAKLATVTMYTIVAQPSPNPDVFRGALFTVFAPDTPYTSVAELCGVDALNAFMRGTFRSLGEMARETVKFPRRPFTFTVYGDPLDIITNKNRAAADMAIQRFVRDMYTY
jgi:hypothetical protein